MDVDEYIKGVLPNEISSKWPMEVIKAQAVAARSFAMNCVMKNKDKEFDLTDTTFSQVYKGVLNENPAFNQAIKDTTGEVLYYDHEIIQAFFHAACGGQTEDASKVWSKAFVYLRSVPCNYCENSPYYQWEASFTDEEIMNILKKKGYQIDDIRAIIPAEMSSSGRWIEAKIIGNNQNLIIKGNDFRMMLGIEKLKSTKFRIIRSGHDFIIKGKGWGHGVGMCQWGAKAMAEKGYKYYQILSYYYRGVELKKIDSKEPQEKTTAPLEEKKWSRF